MAKVPPKNYIRVCGIKHGWHGIRNLQKNLDCVLSSDTSHRTYFIYFGAFNLGENQIGFFRRRGRAVLIIAF